jgi:hypothetical protein
VNDYVKVATSAEVWAVIEARHGNEMTVFESFSDPDGTFNGGDGTRGRMETAWGFKGAQVPTLYAKTTWEIDPEATYKRINEQYEYWLCVALPE